MRISFDNILINECSTKNLEYLIRNKGGFGSAIEMISEKSFYEKIIDWIAAEKNKRADL